MPNLTISLTKEQIEALLRNENVTIDLTGETTVCPAAGTSLTEYMKDLIRRLKANGNIRTSETYTQALKKLLRFMLDEDLAISDITDQRMQDYQAWLRKQGLALNTISFYMRILRAVYNKAVDQGLLTDRRPFRHVYTGQAKTRKRALTIMEIRRIYALKPGSRSLCFARDMFLFSFFTRGMAFVDMAHLKTSDIKGGTLCYKRQKTGQQLSIRWEKAMQEIIDRYPSATGTYLLPLITQTNGRERNQYRSMQSKINRDLKEIARMARLSQRLTMYMARHSWATIARDLKVPTSIISEGMGHTNERTTQIYLKNIDVKVIDQANRQVINTLLHHQTKSS